MQINIHAKNIELTGAIKAYVNEKIGSLKKILDTESLVLAEVEVGQITKHHQQGDIFRAEINLKVDGQFFRAEVVKDDLYAAIDELKDSVMMEVRKNKTKKESLFRRGAIKIKRMLRGE